MESKTTKDYKIAASLEHGSVSTGLLALYYCMIIFFTALVILLIVTAISVPESIPYAIFVSCLILLIMSPFFVLLIRHYKLRSEIKLWLQDAVFLTATSNEAGSTFSYNFYILFPLGFFFPIKFTKLFVTFNYNGSLIQKYSGKPVSYELLQNQRNGYKQVFSKYANREITILYSPKYDKVLIIKDRHKK